MAPETPSRRPPPKRVVPPSATAGVTRFLPYIVVGLVAAVLVGLLLRGEPFATHAAALLGVGVIVGLGYAGWQHHHGLGPEDRLRRGVAVVTAMVVVAALAPLLFVLYPPAPQARIELREVGQRREVTLRGTPASVVLVAAGDFKRDVGDSVRAHYRLVVEHDGREELVQGTFQRLSSGGMDARRGVQGSTGTSETKANRHVLRELRGRGRYAITLNVMNDTIAPPIRLDVGAEPFSPLVLGLLYGLLALGILAVDGLLYRRGGEPAYAALMILPLAAVFYLHGHMTRETLPTDMLAAGIVGALAGGLGGELLARLVRTFVSREG